MAGRLKRSIVLLIGWGLLALGVLGLFLPFLQGVLLLLAGLSVLSSQYAWTQRMLQRLRKSFSGLSERGGRIEIWARSRLWWIFRQKPNDPAD